METKDVIIKERARLGLSQDELAERVFVTRQAVSRWENGETIPNTETLKLLSGIFDVSIDMLLGSPRRAVCECCGELIDECDRGREGDGRKNKKYCQWCYSDGEYTADVWRRYAELGGAARFLEFKRRLLGEISSLLDIEGLPRVEDLNELPGEFVNLEYTLPNGERAKFLNDSATYLGSQLEAGPLCYGIVAGMDFILIASYEEMGNNPRLVVYKRR